MKKSCQQKNFSPSLNDSLTFTSYDVCSRLLNAKFLQRLQQRHKIEQLPVQKKTSRRRHSEKEHFLNCSCTYEVSIEILTIRGTPMSRTYTTLKETYASHPSNENW